ncbi:hypothetical protein BC936DRAFT_138272 [Jimgerdemannia flammicorona]|uniref:GST N-terminal domain-containing protein n=1 Tax=Jimgerdemannia flammicorona TaxID=994334 RepID=A0A433DIJ7_9FUNG|nr:hypothetical protein BC936DRAFT_138272 [Jimgerdemannia flammicorona]
MSTTNAPTLFILNKNYSSWSLRPWIVLRHLGIPFNTEIYRAEDFSTKPSTDPARPGLVKNDPQLEAFLSRAGPSRKVPALHVPRDDGLGVFVVHESLSIIEYLAEDHPHLWPTNKRHRALARSLALEMHAGLSALRNYYPMNIRQQHEFDEARFHSVPGIEADVSRVNQIWIQCRAAVLADPELAAHDEGFLFGRFTIVDAMFAPVVSRFTTYRLPVESKAKEYMETVLSFKPMKEWTAEAKKEVQIIKED